MDRHGFSSVTSRSKAPQSPSRWTSTSSASLPTPGEIRRQHSRAATTVDREDWDLTCNVALDAGGVLVSKRIDIEIEMQAVLSNG